jgi:transcriptional regulator with XRE-family HTH domain
LNGSNTHVRELSPRKPSLILKARMAELGLSNADVARQATISSSLVDKLRHGRRRPGPLVAAKIEGVLKRRVWTTVDEYRARREKDRIEQLAEMIVQAEGCSLTMARAKAAERFSTTPLAKTH